MLRRTPLRAKRATPRRNEGRVQHGRIKARTIEPNAEQRRYHDWLRAHGICEGCGAPGHHIHHILAGTPAKVGRRDHWLVILLCAGCHNGRADSVHLLGSEAAFMRVHGVDLVTTAELKLEKWRVEQ